MAPELTAAIVALAVAAVNFAVVELRVRAAARERQAVLHHLEDVQAKVGANRRSTDHHNG